MKEFWMVEEEVAGSLDEGCTKSACYDLVCEAMWKGDISIPEYDYICEKYGL